MLLAGQAATEAWFGKLEHSRDLVRRAKDAAELNGAKETAATYQAAHALREVEAGYPKQARAAAMAADALASNRDIRSMAALALARADALKEAETLAAELDKAYPLDTLVQRFWLPTIRAAIALQRNDPSHAIESLEQSSATELGLTTLTEVSLCPAYVRGEAYLMLHDGASARKEFQKFIDHRGIVVNFQWGALARLGIARAYAIEAAKDPSARDKARAAYWEFLTLWKDADPDTPVLKQAKIEYAKL